MDDEEDRHLELFRLLKKARGWCIFVDEIDKFCHSTFIPKTLKDIIHFQLHLGMDTIFATRRPASIHNDLVSQTDFLYLFRIIEPNDQKYLRQVVGPNFARKSRFLQDHYHYEFTFPMGYF